MFPIFKNKQIADEYNCAICKEVATKAVLVCDK